MNYELRDGIAVLALDDGKANAVGHGFLDFVNEGLDRAAEDGAGAVVLRGREGLFSAGFDLGEFKKGPEAGISMVSRGMALLIRLYGCPLPVIAACTGHAVAMGAFLLLACDTRIGARGDFRVTLPETRISMDLPPILQALTDARVTPRFLTRAVIQSEIFSPELAVEAGFLDKVVDPGDIDDAAHTAATELAELPGKYYAGNKLFARQATIDAMQAELDKFGGAG